MECSGPVRYLVQNVRYTSNITSISYNNFLQNQLMAFCCVDGSVVLSDVVHRHILAIRMRGHLWVCQEIQIIWCVDQKITVCMPSANMFQYM